MFHQPLVWSDELASILFLWLSMLGAVVALRRGEHMRMTALVDTAAAGRARAARRAGARGVARLPGCWSSGPPSTMRSEEAFIVTPALEICNAWRAAAIPVGIGADARGRRCCGWCASAQLRARSLSALGLVAAGRGCVLARRAAARRRSASSTCVIFFVGVVAADRVLPACRSPSPSRSPPSATSR